MFQTGDYIVEVDGQPVWDMDEATEALMNAPLVFTVTVMSLEPEGEEASLSLSLSLSTLTLRISRCTYWQC